MPATTSEPFSREFEEAGAYYAAVAAAQQEVYAAYPPARGEWRLSYRQGLFTSGGKTLHQSPLGSFGTDASWLWAWANEQTHPPGSERLARALWLRAFGERHRIAELVTPRLELAGFPDPAAAAWRLAMLGSGRCGRAAWRPRRCPRARGRSS